MVDDAWSKKVYFLANGKIALVRAERVRQAKLVIFEWKACEV